MKFRITIEQFIHPTEDCEVCMECESKPHWKEISQKEIEIHVAERAARMIEKIIHAEGLDINSSDLRSILFDELHEKA